MKQYTYLQLKRVAKVFPYVLAVTVVMLVGFALLFSAFVSANQEKEENLIFRVAVTGDVENPLVKLAVEAFKTMDETRFSIDFITMPQAEADAALRGGSISAYVMLPEDFIEKAMRGQVDPLHFVTTTDTTDITYFLKTEIAKMVTDMVVVSQQGTYGIGDALKANGGWSIAGEHVDAISLEYFDLVIQRNQLTHVEELGVSEGLNTLEYYLCSLLILFVMIMGLPFVFLYCKKDNSLSVLLQSKGISAAAQLGAEYTAHYLSLMALIAAVAVGGGIAFVCSPIEVPEWLTSPLLVSLLARLAVVIAMLAAFNTMLFELCSNIISGLLLHFFTTIFLCYISGCFYPLYSFPAPIQSIARLLLVHTAREFLAPAFTEDGALSTLLLLGGYALLFFGMALLAKRMKLRRHTGG